MRIGITTSIATAIAVGVLIASGGGGSSTCPLPAFPNAACTGVPTGTVLTAYSGPNPIVVDNTVIDSKETDCLNIKATNVTIKNSYVHGTGCAVTIEEDPSVCVSADGGGICSVTIQDSTLACDGNSGGTAVYYRNYTVIRSEISNCENGFDASTNVSVSDSWVHSLYQGVGAHTDDMQLSGGTAGFASGITVTHNYFTGLDTGGATINSAIIANGGPGDTNIVWTNNLFGGSGYQLYCPAWQSGTPGTGDQVVNNHFENNYGFGHSNGCDKPQLTVSGNVDYPGGNPLVLQ